MAVLAVLVGALVFSVRWEVAKAERRDRAEAANELAQRSLERRTADPVEAAALAVLAHRTARTDETKRALLSSYPAVSGVRSVHEEFLSGRTVALAASPDGGRVVLLEEDTDGDVQGFVVTGLAAGHPVKKPIPGLPAGVDTVAVSDDGKRAAAAGPEGQGVVWDTATHSQLDSWPAHADALGRETMALDFSADGQLVLYATHVETDLSCTEGVEGKHVRLGMRDIAAKRNVGLPSDVLRSEMCLRDVVLPAGDRGEGRVILISEAPPASSYPNPGTLRIRALSHGQENREWEETGLDSVLVGAGGRTLGVQGAAEFAGTYRDPATGAKTAARGAYRAEDRLDPTERFVVDDEGFSTLWYDTRSGRHYRTSGATSNSDWGDGDLQRGRSAAGRMGRQGLGAVQRDVQGAGPGDAAAGTSRRRHGDEPCGPGRAPSRRWGPSALGRTRCPASPGKRPSVLRARSRLQGAQPAQRRLLSRHRGGFDPEPHGVGAAREWNADLVGPLRRQGETAPRPSRIAAGRIRAPGPALPGRRETPCRGDP